MNVDLSFVRNLYSSTLPTIGCMVFSPSSTSLSVEYPVFVFFRGGRLSFSNNTTESCFGERMLKLSPASA